MSEQTTDLMQLIGKLAATDARTIDREIEKAEATIAQLRILRRLIAPGAPERVSHEETPPVKQRKKRAKNGTVPNDQSIAHQRRLEIAKTLLQNGKPMSVYDIAKAVGRSISGMNRSLSCDLFTRLTYNGYNSLYDNTNRGLELATK